MNRINQLADWRSRGIVPVLLVVLALGVLPACSRRPASPSPLTATLTPTSVSDLAVLPSPTGALVMSETASGSSVQTTVTVTLTAVATPTPFPVPTEAPPATATPLPAPTEAPVASSTPAPAPTSVRAATTTPLAPTEPPAAPEIHHFSVDVRDLAGNAKELTFTWDTSGGTSVQIMVGTNRRFIPWWQVEPAGTLTVELAGTLYRDPEVSLTVSDGAERQVTQSITVPWPCSDSYFFAPEPEECPSGPPSDSAAAYQPFEHGRMVWLEKVQAGSSAHAGWIFVLYDDGTYRRYDDSWTEGQLESDPNIVPPPGLYQPVRGFGKLWREDAEVRDRLGWAHAPEQGYTAAWQWQARESIPSVAFLRALDGRVMQVIGEGGGNWEWLVP